MSNEYRVTSDDKPGTLRHVLRKQETDLVPNTSLRNAAQVDEQTRLNLNGDTDDE
jgi:hypothetical protein